MCGLTKFSRYVGGDLSMKRIALIALFSLTVLAIFAVAGQPPTAIINVLTWQYSNSRTGQNLHETVLTTTNVNATNFGKIFSYPVDGNIYAQPLYVGQLTITGQGVHNTIFVDTENHSIYAFEPASGVNSPNPLWHTSLLNPPNVIAYPCLDNHTACTI